MYKRKTWREKMDNPKLPKVVDGEMLLPSPYDIEAVIRTVREGRLLTTSQLRETLAGKYAAKTTCPLLTGILLHIVSEVAEEDAAAGKKRMTPYWRVIKDDGSLNPKFPGGVERQAERLREEGHRVVAGRGKKPPRVSNT